MLENPKLNESDVIDGQEFGKRFQEWTKKHAKLIQELGQMPAETSWGSILEQTTQQLPDNPAIKFEDKILNYKEFNEYFKEEAKRIAVEGFERNFIKKRLEENNGNISRTAELLGMHRQSLQLKMRELNMK